MRRSGLSNTSNTHRPPINEEVRLLDVEMNPPSLIEGSGADMNPGEPLGAQVVHEKGHRIEAYTVFHNGDSIAARSF